jgi:hypothetical protein
MKRIFSVLAVTALLVAMLVASAGTAFAFANPENNGKTEFAPGQDRAPENCTETIAKQHLDGNVSNGHKVPGNTAPTNCDHFYQQ